MLRLALQDVDDAQRFVCAIVTRSGLSLSWSEREDLEQYLLVEAWRLSLRYQPGGISFSTFAGNTLKLRIVDWQRDRYGRSRWQFRDGRVHERERPQLVSLDDERFDLEPLAAWSGDPAADRDETLGRLLADRDRKRAQDIATLGLRPGRRAS